MPVARKMTDRKEENPSNFTMPLKPLMDCPAWLRVSPVETASPTAASKAVMPLRFLGMKRSTSNKAQAQMTRTMRGKIV
jgi:hypothetical protein